MHGLFERAKFANWIDVETINALENIWERWTKTRGKNWAKITGRRKLHRTEWFAVPVLGRFLCSPHELNFYRTHLYSYLFSKCVSLMEKFLDVVCLSSTFFLRTLHHGIMADGYAWSWQDHNPETNNQCHSFQRMTSHLPYSAKETIPHAQIVTGCMKTSYIHVSTTMFCSLYTPAFQFPGNHFLLLWTSLLKH